MLGRDELVEELTEDMTDELANELLSTTPTDDGDLLLAGARLEPPPPPPQAKSNVQEHKKSTRRLHCHTGKTTNDLIFHRISLIPLNSAQNR